VANSYNELFGKGSHSLDADLIGWWECQDNGAADTTLTTSAGANVADGSLFLDSSNFGTLTSSDSPVPYLPRSIEWQSGREATRNRIEFETTGATTWLLWYNATSYSAFNDGIVSRDGTSNFTNSVEINSSGQPRQYIRDSVGSNNYSTGTLSGSATGQWYHIGAVYDPSVKNEIFVDGVSGGASTPGGRQNAQVIEVGRGTQRIRNFNGKTSNVAFFHRELTSAEIDEHRLGPEPINISSPVISGLPNDGEVIYLTSPGIWDTQGNGVITYTYQWQRDGVDISGETGTTYTWTLANDAGTDITCVVTASNDGGSDSAEVTSSNAVQDKSYNKLFGKGNKSSDASLHGYWEMQETSGTTLADSSGNSNDMGGTDVTGLDVTGPTNWLPSGINCGNTYTSRSWSQTVSLTNTDHTIAIWEQTTPALGNGDEGVAFSATTGNTNYDLIYSRGSGAGGITYSIRTLSSGSQVNDPTTYNQATSWYHRAVAVDSSGTSVYADGSQASSSASDLTNATEQTRLGIGANVRAGYVTVDYFEGYLAGAAYFTRKLTAAEISEVYSGPEPLNLTAPSINVPTALTDTLTCTDGTWDSQGNGTVTLSFQWLRDGIPITGAVSNTYNMTIDDLGTRISCRVKASNSGGYDSLEITESNSVYTAKSSPKPVAMSSNQVAWTEGLGTQFTQSYTPANGENRIILGIAKSARDNYDVQTFVYDPGGPDEANFTLIGRNNVTEPNGYEMSFWYLKEADIVSGQAKDIKITTSGNTRKGMALCTIANVDQDAVPTFTSTETASATSVSDTVTTVIDGAAIDMANIRVSRVLTPGTDQVQIANWAVNSARSMTSIKYADSTSTTMSCSISSAADCSYGLTTVNPLPYPENTAAPAVTGTVTVGSTLTCSTGTWSNPGTGSLTYQYQWVRDKNFIPNANSSTYTLRPADQGYRISCVVVASNDSGYDPSSWTQSNWVATSNSYNQLHGGGRHSHDPTLRAFYGCQETSGSTVANNTGDLPDLTHVGTLTTATGPTSYLPSAISFSRSGRYAHAPSTSEQRGRLTILAWSRSRDDGSGNVSYPGNIFWRSSTATGGEQGMRHDATWDIRYQYRANGGTRRYTPAITYTYDTWQFIGGLDVGQFERYGLLDAVKGSVGTNNVLWTSNDTNNRISIGGLYINSLLQAWDGDLAGVRFFSRVLSDDEVTEAYNGPEPVNITEPTVTGTAAVGQVLTTDNGVWDNMDNGAVSYTYSWYKSLTGSEEDEVQIAGETGSTLTVTGDLVGYVIRSRVSGANDGGADEAEITASAFTSYVPTGGYRTYENYYRQLLSNTGYSSF